MVAASLSCLLVASQALAASDPVVPVVAVKGSLSGQQKSLHALNRLTFGPRPEDEATVARTGLESWFQRQLHPELIDDSALEQKLAMFPAMQLSSAELQRRFPSAVEIRRLANQGGGLPSDPVEHAIYADAVALYKDRVKTDPASPGQAGDPGMMAASGQTATPKAGTLLSDGTMSGGVMSDGTMSGSGGVAAPNAQKKGGRRGGEIARMDVTGVNAVLALPADQRFARLVAMSPEEMTSFRKGLRPQERYALIQGLTPEQVESVAAMQGPQRVVAAEALESRLMRDVASERQLQVVMSDFWLNHFSVYVRKNQNEPYALPDYQNRVILPNALGKFEDLLVATAKSPAMLMYLDNWQSIGPDSVAATRVARFQKVRPNGKLAQNLPKGINENYARELMELHTLGVGGGYTQKDVIEVAKCLTGWTIDRPYNGGDGSFVFEENRHEPGSKTVLGRTIPEGGMKEGLTVLHMLATSPSTAHFVSQKLAVRFVSDTPPPALVDRMAATFLKSDGDIKAVLTTMFHSPEFWSPEVYRAKVKTPIEFMTSALRASGAMVNNPLPLVQAMDRLGMPIYGMQTPNGYSWQASEWVSSNALISRMNFALVLSGDRVPGTRTNWPTLLGDDATATPATERKLEAMLLGQPAAERTRATVLAQFNDPTVQKNAEQSFNAKPVSDADADAADANGASLMEVRVARKNGNGRGNDLEVQRPTTPLGTMVGLLLGSPDFQRR